MRSGAGPPQASGPPFGVWSGSTGACCNSPQPAGPNSSLARQSQAPPTKAPPPPAFGSAPLQAPLRTPSHGSGTAPSSDPAPLLALSKLGPQLVRTLFQIDQ